MRLVLPLLIGIACGLPACGGDDDPAGRTATSETAPRTQTERTAPRADEEQFSAAEYRRALNKLCREDRRAADDFGEPATPDQLTSYLRRTLAYSRKREPLYRALEPPPEFRADHRRSLELSDETEASFERVLGAIDAGGNPIEEFSKALPKLADVVDESNRLARRLGVKQCVVEVPAPGAQPPQDPA